MTAIVVVVVVIIVVVVIVVVCRCEECDYDLSEFTTKRQLSSPELFR